MRQTFFLLFLLLTILPAKAQKRQSANRSVNINTRKIPFTLDSHIYLSTQIDGKYVGNIIFDTGA